MGGVRVLNPGSTGLSRTAGHASWLVLDDEDMTITLRAVPYDVDAVVRDLRRRRHPNAAFVSGVLTGQREQYPHPAADGARAEV